MQRVLIYLFWILSLVVPALAGPVSVEVNGIRFTGSLARPVPGDEEVWGEYYYRIIAENIGTKDQTLLLGEKIKTDGFQGFVDQICSPEEDPEKKEDDKYLKPVLGDLRPLTLKPGERSVIAHGSIFIESTIPAAVHQRDCIIYNFTVRDEMKQFYDVWTGNAELRFALWHDKHKPKPASKPDSETTTEEGAIPWSRPADWSEQVKKPNTPSSDASRNQKHELKSDPDALE